MRLGIHTSTSGSLERAALRAAELGANTFQIFSASPRTWRARPVDPAQAKLLRAARERWDLRPLAIHVSYLVNLATPDVSIRAQSLAAFRGELERAAAIGAEYLVLHPGSYRNCSVEEGIAAFALGLRDAAHGFRAPNLTILLENTAGAGCHIGSRFEELREICHRAANLIDLPIGYCLDTCHLLAAGFDIVSPAGLRAALRSAEERLGWANVHLIHANDSKAPCGSGSTATLISARDISARRPFAASSPTPSCAPSHLSSKLPSIIRAMIAAISTPSKLWPGARTPRPSAASGSGGGLGFAGFRRQILQRRAPRVQPDLAEAQVENAYHGQHRHRKERARHAGHFRAREYAEERQQRMDFHAAFHQARRENVILHHAITEQEDQDHQRVGAGKERHQKDG